MPRLPQASSVNFVSRPLELFVRESVDDRAGSVRLLRDTRRAAVEFQEQRWRLAITQAAVSIDRGHLDFVEQFESCHRNASGENRNRRLHGGINVRKRTHGRRHGVRSAGQA